MSTFDAWRLIEDAAATKGDNKGDSKGDNKGDNKGDSKGDSKGLAKRDGLTKGDNKGDSKGDGKGDDLRKGDNKGDSKGDGLTNGDSTGYSKGDGLRKGDNKGDSKGDSLAKADNKGDSKGDDLRKGDNKSDSKGDGLTKGAGTGFSWDKRPVPSLNRWKTVAACMGYNEDDGSTKGDGKGYAFCSRGTGSLINLTLNLSGFKSSSDAVTKNSSSSDMHMNEEEDLFGPPTPLLEAKEGDSKGDGNLRLEQPFDNYPWRLLPLVDARLSESQRRSVASELCSKEPCCLDKGMGRQLRSQVRETSDLFRPLP